MRDFAELGGGGQLCVGQDDQDDLDDPDDFEDEQEGQEVQDNLLRFSGAPAPEIPRINIIPNQSLHTTCMGDGGSLCTLLAWG